MSQPPIKADGGLKVPDATKLMDMSGNALPLVKTADMQSATTKSTPVDADGFLLNDSAASGALKQSLWSSIKATLKTYFDTLYPSGSGTCSGTNTGDNAVNSNYSGLVSNATHTGDATGSTALTLATVNSNIGTYGSATQASSVTVNAKGLVTAASAITVTPALGSITGLGTGVSTFLATPSSANLAAAITDETGSGALVFATSPTLVTPALGNATATSLLTDSNVLLAKNGIYPGIWLGQTLGTYSLSNYAFLLDPGSATLLNTPSGTTFQIRVANGTIATINASGLSAIGLLCSHPTNGIGYTTGAGGTVTQATSRTTGVTLNKSTGAITLVSAAGSTSWQSFTVTNSAVAATDTVIVNQKSGTDLYQLQVTAVAAGSFRISFATTGGTTTEQPVFNFNVIKGVTT